MKDELNKSFKSFGRLVLSLFTFGTRANNEESDVNLGDVNPKNERRCYYFSWENGCKKLF